MDINPYKFQAPWEEYEFAKEIEKKKSSLILFASAWTNAHPNDDVETKAIVPDRTETWNYWFNRLLPLFVEEGGGEGETRSPTSGQNLATTTNALFGRWGRNEK